MTKHKHADLMALYAKDAQETDKPWERWESRNSAQHEDHFHSLNCTPMWYPHREYRRKPHCVTQTFMVGCGLPVHATSVDEAAWDFRDLITCGMGMVVITDSSGHIHTRIGIRPQGGRDGAA